MYKQGKRGNILYSAVGGGSFYNGHNILTPPPPQTTTTSSFTDQKFNVV